MNNVSSIKQSIYVNSEANAATKQKALVKSANGADTPEQTDIKTSVIKLGSEKAMAEAEAIFSRANSYAEVSAQAQKSLQAYEALELSMKREAVSELMGVDIYA